jgi:hypothetical protein
VARSSGAAGPVHGHAFADVSSDEELLAATVPYLERGLRAGDLLAL